MPTKQVNLAKAYRNYQRAADDLSKLEQGADNLTVKAYRAKKATIKSRLDKWSEMSVKYLILKSMIEDMHDIRPKSNLNYLRLLESYGQSAARMQIDEMLNSNYSIPDYRDWAKAALTMDYSYHYDLMNTQEYNSFAAGEDEHAGDNENCLNDDALDQNYLVAHQLIRELMQVTDYPELTQADVAPFDSSITDPEVSAAASRAVLRRDDYWQQLIDYLETVVANYDADTHTIDSQIDPSGNLATICRYYFDAIDQQASLSENAAHFEEPVRIDLDDFAYSQAFNERRMNEMSADRRW